MGECDPKRASHRACHLLCSPQSCHCSQPFSILPPPHLPREDSPCWWPTSWSLSLSPTRSQPSCQKEQHCICFCLHPGCFFWLGSSLETSRRAGENHVSLEKNLVPCVRHRRSIPWCRQIPSWWKKEGFPSSLEYGGDGEGFLARCCEAQGA